MKLKVAIIGLGAMGKNHARVLARIPSVELAAVCDVNDKTATALAREYGCKSYTNVEALLREIMCEAAIVAVPTQRHFAVASMCLKAGLHVLVEKPITDSLSQALSLQRLAAKKKRTLTVGHVERFNPAAQKLHRIINQGKLGTITSIVIRRVGGFPPHSLHSDVITDLAVHDIDICNALLRDVPKGVAAVGRRALQRGQLDSAELLLQYPTGVSAYIQVNWITPVKIRTLAVTGTKGYAELNYITQKLTLFKTRWQRKAGQETGNFADFMLTFGEPEKTEVHVPGAEPLKKELENFLGAIQGKKELVVTPAQATAALKVAKQALGSLR